MKNLLILSLSAILILITLTEKAEAQWGIGAALELRNEDPSRGFGFKVEREVLPDFRMFDLNIRGHFSYFNESNDVRLDGIAISRDMDVYDYGLAAVVGVSFGIVEPFVGLGIGRERFKQNADIEAISFKENSFYWNGFGGAEFQLIPYLKPFIEYRIRRLTSPEDITYDNVGRLAIGVTFRF